MRKYVKPVLFYEHYELSQHIADCAWELKNSSGNQTFAAGGDCLAYGDSKLGLTDVLFSETNAGCTVTDYEGYCYQPGEDGEFKLFMS